MIRLISIELLKLKPARYFWILLVLFFVILVGIPIGTYALGSWITNNVMPDESPLKDIIPFYDFADIWQNFTFLYQYFTVLLSSLIVINVAQEFSLQTARQNVIDGMSRGEFFKGKFLLILSLAAVVSIVVFLLCLIFGLMYSPVTDTHSMFMNVEFIGAYFLHLVHDFLLAMFVALLIRRTGIGVVVLIFYGWIEQFAAALIEYAAGLPFLASILPNAATKVLIHSPFNKYALSQTFTYIRWEDMAISIAWIIILILLNRWIINRRDL
ncbi:MAG: hypothetical protein MK081_10520 [Flavobacteriales bacterium]|nr:hypothetical protein [Flavobacteriales bacterium]